MGSKLVRFDTLYNVFILFLRVKFWLAIEPKVEFKAIAPLSGLYCCHPDPLSLICDLFLSLWKVLASSLVLENIINDMPWYGIKLYEFYPLSWIPS